MNKFILVFSFLSVFNFVVFAQDTRQLETKWETYASTVHGFSVSMPKAPTVINEQDDLKKRQSTSYAVYDDNTVYFVRVTTGLKKTIKESGFTDYKNEQAELITSQDKAEIESRQVQGVELPKIQRLSKFYFDNVRGKIYEVWAVTTYETKPKMIDFIDSFKIEDKPIGNNIETTNSRNDEDEAHSTQSPNELKSDDESVNAKKIPLRVILRPPAKYTEQARKKGIQGTVRLRATFSADGIVRNVQVVTALPYGLTEQAIIAIHKLFFLPGTRGSKSISFTRTVEYNFNLY